MTYTCKVVYMPIHSTGGARGVAFVEAGDRAHAMQVFREQNQGRTAATDLDPWQQFSDTPFRYQIRDSTFCIIRV